jgi:cell shape-determining protein MreC
MKPEEVNPSHEKQLANIVMALTDRLVEKEAEISELEKENTRLRQSLETRRRYI